MSRTACLALCAVMIAACDTAVEPPVNSPVGTPVAWLGEPLRDLTLGPYAVIDDQTVAEISLASYFAAVSPTTGAPVALTYEATAEGAVSVALDGPILRMRPLRAGSGVVVVRARVGDGPAAADTFAVEVRIDCPPGPRPNEADFLPLLDGETWRFQFSRWGYTGSENVREEGTLTLTLTSTACAGETRTVRAQEHMEGTRTRYYNNVPVPPVTTPLVTDRTVQFVETAEGVQLPWPTMDVLIVPRYRPASVDTVRVANRNGLVQAELVPGRLVSFAEYGVPHVSFRTSFSLRRLDPVP